MSSSKLRKISKIIKEISVVKSQKNYDISGLTISLCKFYYREPQKQFKDLPIGDYTIETSHNTQTLVINNGTILDKAESIQVCYELDLTSSKYESDFEIDINRLASSYNEAIDDLHNLWGYIRNIGMVADDTTIDLILPQLDTNEVWVKTEDGYKGVPLDDVEQSVKEIIEKYSKEKIQEINIETEQHVNNVLKPILDEYEENIEVQLDMYTNDKKGELDTHEQLKEQELNDLKEQLAKELDDLVKGAVADKGVMPNGTDWHTLTRGSYYVLDLFNSQFKNHPYQLASSDEERGIVIVTETEQGMSKVITYHSTSKRMFFTILVKSGIWSEWSVLGGGKGTVYEIIQPNHGFNFNSISLGNDGLWELADPNVGADAIAIKIDNDRFQLLISGQGIVPTSSRDDLGNPFIEDEYYFMSIDVPGGLRKEKPKQIIFQPLFHTRTVEGKLVADIQIGEVHDLTQHIVDNETIKEYGIATEKDLLKKLDKVNTIEELKSQNLKVDDIVEVLGYYTAGDGANHKRIIASEDDGSGVQLNNGLWANIVHNGEVNVSWFGVLFDTQYNLEKAKKNYYIIQKFFDYAPKSKKLIFDGKGVLSLIGSHHLSTDGAYLLIEAGCDVKGKYNEGQNGVYYQGGHMIGIGKPRHPKPPFDWHSELIKDVTVELNGTLETIYDNFGGTVTQDHNNNCIGVGVAFNVKVIGTGGVVGSDHKGICFDNACWGCTIDISFIKNCYHYTWNMSADFPIYGFEQSEFEKYKNYRNYVRVRKNIINLNLIDPDNYEIVRIYEGNILVEDCEFIFLNEPKERWILGFRVHKSNFEGRNITFSSNQSVSEVFAVDTHKNFILENSNFTNPARLVKIKSLDTEFEDIRLNNINVYGNCEVIVENSTSTKIDFLLDKCNFLGINSNYEITNGTKELATSTIYGCKIDYSKIKYRKKRNRSLEESLILDIQNGNTILIERNKNFNYTNISLTISNKEHDAERQIINIPLELLGITRKKLIIKYPDFTNQIKKISLVEDDTGNTITITSELNEIIRYAVMW